MPTDPNNSSSLSSPAGSINKALEDYRSADSRYRELNAEERSSPAGEKLLQNTQAQKAKVDKLTARLNNTVVKK